jgi:IclR family acetate operon transcriptional repressor
LTDAELENLFRDRPLLRFTPNTISSLEVLKAHLAEARAKGFAVNNGEDNVGWMAVAAPVFNRVRESTASICVAGPSSQIPLWRVPKLADKVMSAAMGISQDLAL